MISLVVVCEAAADFRISSELTDRVVLGEVDWIEPGTLDGLRRYRGASRSVPFFTWAEMGKLARENNIRAPGFIKGEQARPDAQQARRVLLFLEMKYKTVHGVLLIRDSDNDLSRKKGLEQARGSSPICDQTIIGLAHTKRECWVLAGFEPLNEEERERVKEMTKELGFDPTANAEHLTAKRDENKRSAKRVLNHLTGHDLDREARCWRDTEMALLFERGINSGLTDFLIEIRERIVPLFREEPPESVYVNQ